MIKVYFESDTHAELAAIFDDEEMYDLCRPTLEKAALKARMVVTESIIDEPMPNVDSDKSSSGVVESNAQANDSDSWIKTLWLALNCYREDCIPESSGNSGYDIEWDEICTIMAWVSEAVSEPPTELKEQLACVWSALHESEVCSKKQWEHVSNAMAAITIKCGENTPGTPVTIKVGKELFPAYRFDSEQDANTFIAINTDYGIVYTHKSSDKSTFYVSPLNNNLIVNVVGGASIESYKVVSLSTGHMSHEDSQKLDLIARTSGMVHARDSGFFIKLYADNLENNYIESCSKAFNEVIKFAFNNGFEMIEFDEAAPDLTGFATFDW